MNIVSMENGSSFDLCGAHSFAELSDHYPFLDVIYSYKDLNELFSFCEDLKETFLE